VGTVGLLLGFLTEGLPLLIDDFEAFLCALRTSVANEKGAGFFTGFFAGGLDSVITLFFPIVELSFICSISLMSPFNKIALPGLPTSRFA
jgi:hypothetical protein